VAQPGPVAGPVNPCPTIGTAAGAVYAIAAVAEATGYFWTVPSGVIIRAGQGTTSITVDFTSSFVSGAVRVQALNNCSASSFSQLTLSRVLPGTPGPISVFTVSNNCPLKQFIYTIPSAPSNSDSIIWTVPAGAIIVSGQNSTSINVQYPANINGYSGSVTVRGKNGCGLGNDRNRVVNISGCPRKVRLFNPNILITLNSSEVVETVNGPGKLGAKPAMDVRLSPNPVIYDFNLNVKSVEQDLIHVRVIDLQGREYLKSFMRPGETLKLGNNLRGGAYLVELRQGSNIQYTRFVKLN
jgi:hypothetical protein